MIYRILSLLKNGKEFIRPGVANLNLTPEQETKLIAGGFIARISPPRLDVLPGWENRAKRLAKVDIFDALELLQAGDETAKLLRVKPADFQAWQAEIKQWLLPQED